jgi:hypothetical protein
MRRTWHWDPSTNHYKSVHGMLWHIGMVTALMALALGLVVLALIVRALTPRRRFKPPPPPTPRQGKAVHSITALDNA